MSFFSLLAGKIIDITSDVIVAVALHVPFIMTALTGSGYIQPVPVPAHHVASSISITTSPKSLASTSTIPDEPPKLCTNLCAPFDWNNLFTGEREPEPYINPHTNDRIDLEELRDVEHQSRNPTFDLSLNGAVLGEVTGQGISQESFSPNDAYFALRTRSTMGCVGACQDFDLRVVDIKSKKLLTITTPVHESIVPGVDKKAAITPVIDSYAWDGPNTLTLIFFYIATGIDSNSYKSYRVSSKEIWRYDLSANTHTLVKILQEPLGADPYTQTDYSYGVVGGSSTSYSSPDGKYQAVSSSNEQGDSAIYIKDAKGTPVTFPHCGFYASWSSDSTRVKVLLPPECGYSNHDSYYYLDIDGAREAVEGSTFIPFGV